MFANHMSDKELIASSVVKKFSPPTSTIGVTHYHFNGREMQGTLKVTVTLNPGPEL